MSALPTHGGEVLTPGPRIGRSVTLRFLGDWGTANFHRIGGWLCQEFCARAGPDSRVWIGNSDGQADTIRAVSRGEVDLAITTPVTFVHAALTGEGLFDGDPAPGLRGLAVIPHRDMLLLALAGELRISSFAELRERRPPIRIATSADDGVSHLGYVARRLMEAEGIDEQTLESWGGGYVNSPRPDLALELLRESEVDGVLTEAIMTSWWRDVTAKREITVLAVDESVLDQLDRDHGWRRSTLPADTFEGQRDPVVSLDFSDFVVFVRSDMAEDVAHLLTWCLVETRGVLEGQYRHLAPERSPVAYPLDPSKMGRTPFPRHPGADRYYRDAGLL